VVLTSKDGIVWTRLAPIHSDRPAPIPTPAITGNNQNAVISENVVAIELNGQAYKLNLTASIGQSMEVQASTNLESWDTLTTITNNGGILNFVDHDATNYPMRFYRLKLQ
jgi:hemin uptake protein HemP